MSEDALEETNSLYDGTVIGNVWTVEANPTWYSTKFTGFSMKYEVLEALIDAGIEFVVFIDPNRGRYTSTIDDWQEFGTEDDDVVHLRQSWMVYG